MKAIWTFEQKTKALTIAATISITEAARQTGIPAGTIKRWRSEANRTERGEPGAEPTEPNRTPKKLEELQAQAVEKAIEEAGDYIAGRLKSVADKLYSLAEKAADKVSVAISDSSELPKERKPEPHTTDGAAWVRALVGVMAQSVDKAQLLSGKPTARPEVIDKHVYDITQRIIGDPEAVELANNLLRRAAGRDPGPLRVHSQRGPLDTV